MEYDVSVIRDPYALEGITPEWREFLARSPHGRGFDNDPTVIGLAMEADPRISPRIVIVRRGGDICCIAPFGIHPTRLKLEVSVLPFASMHARVMKVFGGDLIHAGDIDRDEVFGVVFRELDRSREHFDLIYLESIPVAGGLWEYCATASQVGGTDHRTMTLPRYEKAHHLVVDSSGHDGFMKSLGSSTRQSLRRNTRKLLNEHRGSLLKVTEPDQVRPFLAKLDEVYCDSWQARTFGFHPRNTEAQAARMERIAERGWLRCYLLQIGDTPISFQVGYLYDRVYYARDFAFGRTHAGLSPGSVLMNLFVEDLLRGDDLGLIDLGYGDMPHKKSFRGVPRDVASAYLSRSAYWRRVLGVQACLSCFEDATRSMLTRIGLDRAVRRVLKHKG